MTELEAEEAIELLLRDAMDCCRRRDIDGFMSLFAENAVGVYDSGTVVGREAILEAQRPDFEDGLALIPIVIEARFLSFEMSGPTVYVVASVRTTRPGFRTPSDSGLMVFRIDGGGARILIDCAQSE